MEAYLALDAGGTVIKSAVLDENGFPLFPIRQYPARSEESASVILSNLSHVAEEGLSRCRQAGFRPAGMGVAFPGPFDYTAGISRIRGIGKYDSIYGLSLKEYLAGLPDLRGLPLFFANDADLFCLGECLTGKGRGYRRVMLACIGTGIGSGFVADGRLIKKGDGVPAEGWIYSIPYKDSILDAWLSASGIRRMIQESGAFPAGVDVKELAAYARGGHAAAQKIFTAFADMLAEALPPFVSAFEAEALILGGQVARSAELFSGPLAQRLAQTGVALHISEDSALSAMRAVPLLFQGKAAYPYL